MKKAHRLLRTVDISLTSLAMLSALALAPTDSTSSLLPKSSSSKSFLSHSAYAQTTPTFPFPTEVPAGTTVKINGSSSMATVNEALRSRFESQVSDGKVNIAYDGSDRALQDLVDGKMDLAAIGRPLTDAEKAEGLVAVPISRHKIAMIVGRDNPFDDSLTDEQFGTTRVNAIPTAIAGPATAATAATVHSVVTSRPVDSVNATATAVPPLPQRKGVAEADLIVHNQRNCFHIDPQSMARLQRETSVSRVLQPGTHTIKLKSGAFDYQVESGHPGEPIVLLWIYGGKVMNHKTEVEVGATWSSLNGYGDTLTLDVREPANLCAFFFDTHLEDNEGEIVLSLTRV